MSSECARCGDSEPSHRLLGLDLCHCCYQRLHSDFSKTKVTGIKKVEKGTQQILEGLRDTFGLDISDNNFTGTPKRVARAYYEMCLGINCSEDIDAIVNTAFPSTYGGMVISKGISCYSLCPHHLLPVIYSVDVGYIPKDKAIGLSKIPRIVKLLSKAPKLQEQFTQDIADVLHRIECQGGIVQVRGKHQCMGARGVEQPQVVTMTSSIFGNFENLEVRNEFQLLIQNNTM